VRTGAGEVGELLAGAGVDVVGDGVGVGDAGPVLGVVLGAVGLVEGCGRLLGASEWARPGVVISAGGCA
jgi:hypothetical protein